MKNKLVGILVCILLIITVFPITGQILNNKVIKENDEDKPFTNGDNWIKTYD